MSSTATSSHVRVLILDDTESDAELVKHELRMGGIEFQSVHVATEKDFLTALDHFHPDIILADYSLPQYDGLSALSVSRARHRDTPFILVTGSLDEETAVDCIKAGASDYVVKERLFRLVPAVKAALARRRSEEHQLELEHQLMQSQKMEAVGQLAGGVAHDFNNLLMVILNSALFLQDETQPNTDARGLVDDILNAANQASGLTRQLLAFSRRQMLTPKDEDLNLIVSELQKMLKRLLHENIEISVQTMPQPCPVRVDRGQIEQVLVNLAVNARDAMPGGGTLFLDVQCRDLDINWAYVHSAGEAFVPGRYAVLTVSDTGCGMSEEQAARIFDPFYTTKPAGQGTGLGLSTVYGIVNQHGGRVAVYSHPGQGTTFHIYLPCADGKGVQEAEASSAMQMPSGAEKILIVEDAAAVRQVTERILRNLGYRTASATCGEDALTLIQHAGSMYDLILTDIMMPGIDGCELAERVRGEFCDVKILFMSGYPQPLLENKDRKGPLGRVLSKPFSAKELAVAVRETLDE